MKIIKKIGRIILFVVVISLVSVGIGMAGGVPIFLTNRKAHTTSIKVEMVDKEEESVDEEQCEIKS